MANLLDALTQLKNLATSVLNGVTTVTGTPASGKVLQATSPTTAEWTTPSGGGFGATTQTDVTGSRSIGVIYQNLTGKTMFVNVTVLSNGGGTGVVTALTDSSATPTVWVASQYSSTLSYSSVAFFVLNNNYYQITGNTNPPHISKWVETV